MPVTRTTVRIGQAARLSTLVLAAVLLGCGSTEPASGTAGRYMLVGCTYPGRGITTLQACRGDDIAWDAGASYYDLGADGRVTFLSRAWLPSLAALGAGGQLDPSIRTGTWTESPGAVTVTWDGDVGGLLRKVVERIDADTLRDTNFAAAGTLFWFVKAR